MTAIWLVGVMGAGKTTTGRLAASLLGVPFRDTDELIESQAGMKISEIWARDGEEGFRALESAVIASLAGSDGIVATGGGAVLDPDNRRAMTGVVVWLTASPQTVADRVDSAGRPLLAGSGVTERVATVLAEREAIYLDLATDVVATDGLDEDAVAERIARLWPK